MWREVLYLLIMCLSILMIHDDDMGRMAIVVVSGFLFIGDILMGKQRY